MQISIGQYIPNNTIIHKLDPRTKIISLFLMMYIIFANINWKSNLLISVVTIIGIFLSKTSLKTIFKTLKPLWIMFLILGTLNIFLIKTGPVVFEILYLNKPVHLVAITQTSYIFLRISLVICMSIILTSSTDPLRLTLGIETLMKPLNSIGVPVPIFAMMISIALRFIPTLLDETHKIIKAQASRGLDFYNGGFKTKIKAIIALIVPLLVTSFNKADELALAMEAKNYNPLAKRPRYRIIKFAKIDYITLTLLFSYFIWIILEKLNIINILN